MTVLVGKELDVLAAVVLGGASLTGGVGSVFGINPDPVTGGENPSGGMEQCRAARRSLQEGHALVSSAGGCIASSFFQAFVDPGPRCRPCRQQSKDHSGQERQTKCEGEHSGVNADFLQARKIFRLQRDQQTRSPPGNHYADCAACQ